MNRNITISINAERSARLDALLGDRTAYAYTLEALLEKMQRDEEKRRDPR